MNSQTAQWLWLPSDKRRAKMLEMGCLPIGRLASRFFGGFFVSDATLKLEENLGNTSICVQCVGVTCVRGCYEGLRL